MLLGLINNKLTGYRDFLSGGANILAVSQDKWHMSFKFMVLECYIENYFSHFAKEIHHRNKNVYSHRKVEFLSCAENNTSLMINN